MAELGWVPLNGDDRITLRHVVKEGEGAWRTIPDIVLGWMASEGEVLYALSSGKVIEASSVLRSTYDWLAMEDADEWWAWS